MKLIDILVEELPNRGGWPEGVLCATQSVIDGEIYFYNRPYDGQGCMLKMKGKILLPISYDSRSGCEGLHPVITREQYEAALAAKNDGWIEWGGGECPVDGDALVEVKYRNGTVKPAEPARFYIWTNGYGSCSTTGADIIAYRLHQPQEVEMIPLDECDGSRVEDDLNECIGQDAAPVWNGEGQTPPVGFICERSWAGDEWQPCKILFTSDQIVVVKLKGSGMEDAYNIGDVTFRPIRSEAEWKREKAIAALVDFKIGYHCHPKAAESYLREVTALYDAIAAGKIPSVKLED